ncbi:MULTISPECIES: hypothetical protein [Pseudonocardia]|uniref:hypothetical protein n=1 Tax=Pseudonocardia TaxID=1847 RepID=UPI001AD7D781|nr:MULTISPECIES: hypothetical protein [Pseudonocardia]MBO4237270.1 hypothetical protein [Pseudonocardia alni]
MERRPGRRRSRAARGAVLAVVAALVLAPAAGAAGAAGPVSAALAGPAETPPSAARLQHAPAADAEPPGTLRELLAAITGSATADPLDLAPGTLAVDREGEEGLAVSWALLDTGDGRWTGSADAATRRSEAESTIKAWLALDTLRAAAQRGRPVPPAVRADIAAAVRASDDDAAERLYRALGRDASTARLAPECGVTVSTSRPGWWSYTQVSALDAARVLACVRERAPALPGGPELLADLDAVTPDGRSGIRPVLPGAVAEKNGWTLHGGDGWNVHCVLAWEDRALAVLTTYPGGLGVEHGWQVCRDVAADVLATS